MNRDKSEPMSPFEIDQLGKAGSIREALSMALKEIRSGTRGSDLFYLAARLAFELGDISKSEQLLNHLLALDPEHLNGWVLYGKVYRQKGDFRRAAYGKRRAEEIFPALLEFKLLDDLELPLSKKTGGRSISATGSMEIFETETYADICVRQGYFNKALKIYGDLKTRFPENEGLGKKIEEVRKKMGKND